MKYLKILSLVFCTLFFGVNCKAHAGVKQIETKYNVKIGVYAIDTNNGNSFSYRQDERFPFQSTVKMIVAAAALNNIEADERVKISSDDIVFWSPIVRLNLDRGYMTIKELAEAAMSYSDNAATNILITRLGGTKSINEFAKSIGNTSFYLENLEPNLNADPNNIHDSSTPKDMAQSVQKLLIENNILGQENQHILKTWMINNTTGYKKIRYGLPLAWSAAEKTGGGSGTSHDIGIVWSPACKPIVLAIYTFSNKKDNVQQADKAIAETTKFILDEFSKKNTCFAATDFK
jgi:beta-lactamase class A